MPISTDVLRGLKRGNTFIETGCDLGDGIAAALGAGFEKIISIEINPGSVAHAEKRFAGRSEVTILQGDTIKVLPGVVAELREPVTFWLDAHPATWSPVLQELAVIAASAIKEHTILIDDRRMMIGPGHSLCFFTPLEHEVHEALLRLNPKYHITYADGFIPNDIIVARAL